MQLSALAQVTRLSIFRELIKVMDCNGDSKGLAAGDLAERLAVASPTLSFHLKELSRAGLVICERDGRHLFYRVNGSETRSLINFMLEDCCSEHC